MLASVNTGPFALLVAFAALCAGAVASMVGFGIGSILTPLLSIPLGTKLAVALVSIPHLAGTALRFAMIKERVDRKVLRDFGLMSAAGGLAGALLHARLAVPALTLIFGAILVFAGAMGVTGLSRRLRFGRRGAWLAGGVSGGLGGLVGNQGGIRSAAMLSFDIPKTEFVATATAIGLIVDGARMPVYLYAEGGVLAAQWRWVLLASAGVLAGTLLGTGLLRRVPENVFRRIVSAVVLILGFFMLWRARAA
jgi:uncharacterized membrane protein YfcA